MAVVTRLKDNAAPKAFAFYDRGAVLAAAMGVERGGTVGTDNPQVLDPVVVSYAIDVIEDETHAIPVPQLSLAAELTLRLFETFR